MPEIAGSFTFVLHAHLPYVLSHGRWPHGTDWLNEAAAETYLPLLEILDRLVAEGISPKLTIGITPILGEQLRSPAFCDEFDAYLRNKLDAAEADEREFSRVGPSELAHLARHWRSFYARALEAFRERYRGDIVGAFAALQEAGHVEVITSAATHGYLPLLSRDTCVQAQIRQGVRSYRRQYGRAPRGIWLPECAYRPRYRWAPPASIGGPEPTLRKGIEEFVAESELGYFLIDSHLLRGGRAIGVYLQRFPGLQQLWRQYVAARPERPEEREKSPYEGYWVASTPAPAHGPVAVFTRDPETGLQVWSGAHGYPGTADYLDFHKKRWPGGHRYWRVTDPKADLADKEPYLPEKAQERIPEQAHHFGQLVRSILGRHHRETGRAGILVAPYDAELFGHWWFEGPRWLYHVVRDLAKDGTVALTTCGAHLGGRPPETVIALPEGSWGEGGFHWIWLNEWTEWTWRHVYRAEAEMERLARTYGDSADPRIQTILRQAARELLLLESSDWQFLISTWSARDYAEMRLSEHAADFARLAGMADRYGRGDSLPPGDWEFLGLCEERDRVFEDIEPAWYAGLEAAP